MGNKRSPDQIKNDRRESVELLLMGYSHREINDHINGSRPYEISLRQTTYDIQKVRQDWLAVQRQSYEGYINEELERLTIIEREAWRSWRASQGGDVERLTEEIARSVNEGEDTELFLARVTTRLKESAGNPRFLEMVHKIQQERRKILGLYAPARLGIDIQENREIVIKGYGAVSPDNWPEPSTPGKRLGDGIIDGEFS